MSDTPRTDALLDKYGVSDDRSGDAGALRDFSRQLERELLEMTLDRDALADLLGAHDSTPITVNVDELLRNKP